MTREKVEYLKQLELVVQIPLEPENDFVVVGKSPQAVVAVAKVTTNLIKLAELLSCEELRPNLTQV